MNFVKIVRNRSKNINECTIHALKRSMYFAHNHKNLGSGSVIMSIRYKDNVSNTDYFDKNRNDFKVKGEFVT